MVNDDDDEREENTAFLRSPAWSKDTSRVTKAAHLQYYREKQRQAQERQRIYLSHEEFFDRDDRYSRLKRWIRPYWLGLGLFFVLAPFWILDSLKDPILGVLVSGNLDEHLPRAKIVSVLTTISLVCFLEYISHQNKHDEEQQQLEPTIYGDEDNEWQRMDVSTRFEAPQQSLGDRMTGSMFAYIGIPYCVAFGMMAYLLQFKPEIAYGYTTNEALPPFVGSSKSTTSFSPAVDSAPISSQDSSFWPVLGYFFYATIESFGSLMVATFWSYTNSTLSLNEAEKYYGPIIALAQLGAIAGSTAVTVRVWSNVTLVILSCLIIVLHVVVMTIYAGRYPPSRRGTVDQSEDDVEYVDDIPTNAPRLSLPALWSGVYLILRHNYVLLILGVSCLYEVSLTCLNYQMIILGWQEFSATYHPRDSNSAKREMRFEQFMGHYGQLVNVSSLVLSSLVFPRLVRTCGLRWTLLVFPTLLMIANILAFGALPGNLTVLFISVSFLKAVTYSVHDPAKEILYLPTSSAIQFKAKFWIDVVGARIAKAIGSSINTYAGSVHRSIRVASAPSLLTASLLWFICYRAGLQFNHLIHTDSVVGVSENDAPRIISKIPLDDDAGFAHDESAGNRAASEHSDGEIELNDRT
jgi:TLC ATP/ADP transporter